MCLFYLIDQFTGSDVVDIIIVMKCNTGNNVTALKLTLQYAEEEFGHQAHRALC